VLPFGTGNDFARTIGMPRDLAPAWDAIRERRTRRVDVVALERDHAKRWFVNMSVGGAIDQIHDRLSDEMKKRWGPLAYVRAGAEALTALLDEIGPHRVEIVLDEGEPIELEVWSVAIANGRTVGGGIPVAPAADVSDGLLDCIAIAGVRGLEMAKVAAAVILGKHLDGAAEGALPEGESAVFFRRARSIEVRSDPPMPFTTDGEVNPASESWFTAHPAAIEMIVGPE
jgi:diacylglycerol kinase (ATP)